MISDIYKLVRGNIRNLAPYSTARDDFKGIADTWLDANESPYAKYWNRYPDPRQKTLKARISELKGIPSDNIFLGNGSDEAIDLIYRIFCVPGVDNVVAVAPTYGMYEVAAGINDVEYRPVQLGEEFAFNGGALLEACDANTKAIFICSPNNPTGNSFPCGQMLDVARKFDGIVVIDEAYIDFCDSASMSENIADFPNIVALQTLSKARGMAALRIGMAFADRRIIGLMNNVKYPYNISGAAQSEALKLLDGDIRKEVNEICRERSRVRNTLSGYRCIEKIYPSQSNFVLVKVDDPDKLYDWLVRDGIIVRNRNKVKGCEGCLRITVGLAEENDRLFKSLGEYEKSDIY